MKKTKKARAFELFSQGYVPLSEEIKAIGLHPSNRYKYFYEWEALGRPIGVEKHHSQAAIVGTKSSGGEIIGGVDETKAKPKIDQEEKPESAEVSSPEEPELDGIEDEAKDLEPEEAPLEKPKTEDEAIGVVSEVVSPRGKDGKLGGPERKIATTIADDGIKCTIFLSLQTLALFRIAATTQAQINGGEELSLGDFLDTCAEDFFGGRGKKLGLISSGGK